MKIKYFACAQANAISTEFQYLKGMPVNDGNLISMVAVAPYSRILQWGYVNDLLQGLPVRDLQRKYFNGRFDVIVVWLNPAEPNGFGIMDLRSYLIEKSIPFDPARYECLRTAKMPNMWARLSIPVSR